MNKPSKFNYDNVVNTIFYKINLAFPVTYQKAFATLEEEAHAKGVWLEQLKYYPPERIMAACDQAIHNSYYFVDLSQILKYCRGHYADLGLPSPINAYHEACLGYKTLAQFSHAAIYLAAQKTGWWLLQTEPQSSTLPIFQKHYETLCYRLRTGEDVLADMNQIGIEDQRQQTLLEQSNQMNSDLQKEQMRRMKINPKGGREAFLQARKQRSS